MARPEGKRHKASTNQKRCAARIPAGLALSALACALALSGCKATGTSRQADPDPLFGGAPSKARADSRGPAPTPVAVLPPAPAPNGATSTAALAGGQPRQFDPDKDLRIGSNPAAASGVEGWAGPGAAPRPDGGATLHNPELAVKPAAQREAVPVSHPAPPSGQRLTSYDEALAKLKARGALWQRLEAAGNNGEWTFLCSIPSPKDPNKHRTYDAHARDYLSAVQAVLDQIDRDQ